MNSGEYNHLNQLAKNYRELQEKTVTLFLSGHVEQLDRFHLIQNRIKALNIEIETILIEIDAQRYNLTTLEDQRIIEAEIIERSIDRIKPIMLLSLMYENGLFESITETQFDELELDKLEVE